MNLLHITSREDWETARKVGIYLADSLEQEGFIHCSTFEQIISTANRFYRNCRDLVVLVIDAERVKAPIQYENLEGGQPLFPHIYGSLNCEAVIAAVALVPDEAGWFELPQELIQYKS